MARMKTPKKASIETVLKAVVSLGERVAELPTKNDVERIVEEKMEGVIENSPTIQNILKEVRAVSRAVDKDAVTIVNHGKRITRVEQHLAVK